MSSPTAATSGENKDFHFELISMESAEAPEVPSVMSATMHRPNKSPRDPTIRHAGRVHIRGKIRRCWRPRYLELDEKGLVRYYELPSTADVTMPEEADWQHVNMVIKDTLIIHHARIIDVTTLRDLHVGLPRGSYGFLFRGQRLSLDDLLPTKIQEPDTPREYFCAVSTLEEAQTWVIALQWAAAMCKKNRIAGAFYHDDYGYRSSNESLMPKTSGKMLQCGLPGPPGKPSTASRGIADDAIKGKDASKHKEDKKKGGRMLVTKVHGFRVIRDDTAAPAFRWEVAYEVALLMVHHRNVEERRILLTPRDVEDFLNELATNIQDPVLKPFWDQLIVQAKALPRFRAGSSHACSPQAVADAIPKMDGILRSLTMEPAAVNSQIMKSALGLDAVNPIMRELSWWKLPKGTTDGRTVRFVYRKVETLVCDVKVDEFVRKWLIQTANACQTQQSISLQWPIRAQFVLLRRPWFLMTGVGVTAALLYPASQVYQQNIFSIPVRADVVVVSWFAAYFLGKKRGMESAKQQRISSLHSSALGIPRVSKGLPPTGPIVSSPTQVMSFSPIKSTLIPMREATELDDESSMDGDDVDSVADEVTAKLSSPIPQYPENDGQSCWSEPSNPSIFRVRGNSYLEDRVKIPSGPSPFKCRGVDIWMTDNPERHIARHPSVLGGKLGEKDTFLVNFLLPFGNFVSYFSIPPLKDFPNKQVADVWTKFINGDQQYRDARLKLLPIALEGPWIVKAAVGNGTAPALLGKVMPLQYFFRHPQGKKKGVYEVDVIITASTIAKGILGVVKGHTNYLTLAFALIIEASEQHELPETILCSFQVHSINLEDCPKLPNCNLDAI